MALLPDLLRAAGSPEAEKLFRDDPVLAHNFLVTLIDTSSPLAAVGTAALSAVSDNLLGGFTECSGLEMSLAVEDWKEGGNNGTVLKFPGRISWGNISLKRGVTKTTALWDWQYGFVAGKGKRRDGVIVLMNELHVPNNIWFFRRGLPLKYTGPSMNAAQNGVAIDSLEIAHEGIFQIPFVGAASGIADAIASGSAAGLVNAAGSAITAGINL
jgi:phage tail-like protein